jgi:hypothetical protein
MEENFLDDKSNGFQLEASLIRDAKALERLFHPGDHHAFPGSTRHCRGRTRQATLG